MRASHCNDVASDSVALETSARLEGYYPTVITSKIGKRAVLQPDIRIENLRIPAENHVARHLTDMEVVHTYEVYREHAVAHRGPRDHRYLGVRVSAQRHGGRDI